MDFGVLPPEINSGRMYAGPGSGPMLAAAAAWDGLATELQSTAADYGSVISVLTGVWSGQSSGTMAAAAAPYVAWMSATAALAREAAAQASAAAAAYEAAFAATVPPPVVAANRAELAVLAATNIFGQNTGAIAAAEARYAEMWAQDAAGDVWLCRLVVGGDPGDAICCTAADHQRGRTGHPRRCGCPGCRRVGRQRALTGVRGAGIPGNGRDELQQDGGQPDERGHRGAVRIFGV